MKDIMQNKKGKLFYHNKKWNPLFSLAMEQNNEIISDDFISDYVNDM